MPRPNKKPLLYFLLFACCAFLITATTRAFVMASIHQNYRDQYTRMANHMRKAYDSILGSEVDLAASELDDANQKIYQFVGGALPDLVLHYGPQQQMLSLFSPKIKSQQVLKKLHDEVLQQSGSHPEKDFFVSSQMNFLFVRYALRDSVATYLVYFDRSYDQKDFYVNASFTGAYVSLLILFALSWFLLSRRKKEPKLPPRLSVDDLGGELDRSVVVGLAKVDRQALQEALAAKQNLLANTFLLGTQYEQVEATLVEGDIRPLEYVSAYKELLHAEVDNMALLKEWVEKGLTLNNQEELLQALVSPLIALYSGVREIHLYLAQPNQIFFLACSYKNNLIECFRGSPKPSKHLYGHFGVAGDVVRQRKPVQELGDKERSVMVPYLEDCSTPVLLQMNFSASSEPFVERDFLFLKGLLRAMTEAISNFKLAYNRQVHGTLGVLNEGSLLARLGVLSKQKLDMSEVALCLLKPTPLQGHGDDMVFGELIQKHFAAFLRQHRSNDISAYALGNHLFALLFSKPFPYDPKPLLEKLVWEVRQKPIQFFNQTIHLDVQVGMATAIPGRVFDAKGFLAEAKGNLSNNHADAVEAGIKKASF